MTASEFCTPYLRIEEPDEEDDDDEDEEEEPEPEEDELLPSFSSILARVFAPTTPSAVRPFLRWKSMTAASVLEPKWPLTVPV